MKSKYHFSAGNLSSLMMGLAFALGVAALPPIAVQGQSLWPHRDPWRAHLFADTHARCVGDLLTVIVREMTDVENNDQRRLDSRSNAGFNFDFSSAGDGGSASAELETATNANRTFNGQSQYSVEQELADRITVQVVQVQPNGNLVISGQRQRMISGEIRTLTLSGIVRPIDIRPDNSVESQFVGNFRIDYLGGGPESRFTNQGWLGRFGNRWWPF